MKRLPIRLVIPDTGVLISLAHGNLLEQILNFTEDVRLTITDAVAYEATHRQDLVDAQRVREFIDRNKKRITVQPTAFHSLVEEATQDASRVKHLPKNMGEISAYGYLNELRNDEPGIPALIIFEDEWFLRNQYTRPRNTHLLSMVAFLKYMAAVDPKFSFRDALDSIKATRPGVNTIDIDIPAESKTAWKPKVRKP